MAGLDLSPRPQQEQERPQPTRQMTYEEYYAARMQPLAAMSRVGEGFIKVFDNPLGLLHQANGIQHVRAE